MVPHVQKLNNLNKQLAVTQLQSGVFRPADQGLAGATVDVYLVGGGAGGNGGAARSGGSGGNGLVYIYAAPQPGVVPAGSRESLYTPATLTADPLPGAFVGELTPLEIMACDKTVKACGIKVGILRAGRCVDIAMFQTLTTAEEFLANGVWPEADDIAELPDDHGIGDAFDGKIWGKAVAEVGEEKTE